MRTVALGLIIFILLNSFTEKLNGQSNHNFGFFISPTLSYRSLENNVDLDHKMALRYDVGLNYYYSINNRIKIGTGFAYSRMGYDLHDLDLMTSEMIDYIFYRNFIELPLFLKYNFKKSGKNSFFIDFGIINQILINQETKVKQSDKKYLEEKLSYSDLKNKGFKTYNIASVIGFSINRSLNEHIYLSMSPFFKYALLSLNNIHDLSIGLKIGLGLNY